MLTIYLYRYQVGVFVRQNDQKIRFNINSPEDGILPPVPPENSEKVTPGCQGNAKDSCQQGVVEEGLSSGNGYIEVGLEQLTGDTCAAEKEREKLA